MSFDYDRLQYTVNNLDAPEYESLTDTECELYEQAEDLARELLRLRRELTDLRDGVKQLADDFGANAEYAPNIHAHTAYIEAEQRLTNLLEGDTK